ncbi:MAG: hypothetical protein ACRCS0_00995 [Albidovulum sp.]
MTLAVVYWLYDGRDGHRNYSAAHLNAQLPMLRRHLHTPYRVIAITDNPQGLDRSVEVFPDPVRGDGVSIPGTHPTCLRRLWNFGVDAKALGKRILALDLDGLIVRDITPIVECDDDLVVWRSPSGVIQGCGYLLKTGTYRELWEGFGFWYWAKNHGQGRYGYSDQGWINHALRGIYVPDWGDQTYIPRRPGPLPDTARIVSFDRPKPWTAEARQQFPWISDHYELKNV